MFIKILGLLTLLALAAHCELQTKNGPYRASGWKPDGPSFELPTKSNDGLQSSYGPPIRTQPDREYGLPTVSSFVRPKETIETSEVELIEPVRLETNYEDDHHYHKYIKHYVAPPPQPPTTVERLIVSQKSHLEPEHIDIVRQNRHHVHHYHHYNEPLARYSHHPHILRYQLRL